MYGWLLICLVLALDAIWQAMHTILGIHVIMMALCKRVDIGILFLVLELQLMK